MDVQTAAATHNQEFCAAGVAGWMVGDWAARGRGACRQPLATGMEMQSFGSVKHELLSQSSTSLQREVVFQQLILFCLRKTVVRNMQRICEKWCQEALLGTNFHTRSWSGWRDVEQVSYTMWELVCSSWGKRLSRHLVMSSPCYSESYFGTCIISTVFYHLLIGCRLVLVC